MTETPWWEDEDPDRPKAEYKSRPKPPKAKPKERASRTPTTWTECLHRLAYAFGGPSDDCAATAQEWVEQALEASWGVRSLHAVTRQRRQIALQRTVGIVLWLEDQGETAFRLDLRELVQATFARYWKGVRLEGPPWRLTPFEDLPTFAEWASAASFDPSAEHASVP